MVEGYSGKEIGFRHSAFGFRCKGPAVGVRHQVIGIWFSGWGIGTWSSAPGEMDWHLHSVFAFRLMA